MGPAQLFSHAPSLPRHLSALLLLLSLSLSLLFFLLVITASPSVCFPFQSLARDFERVESEKKQRASKIMGAVGGGWLLEREEVPEADFVLLYFE